MMSSVFEKAFQELGRQNSLDASLVARVIAEHRGSYRIVSSTGEYVAKITGKQMFDALSREDYPAVGDWVAITKLDTNQAVIKNILPRKTILKRKRTGGSDSQVIAANVDVAFVVQAVGRDFSINRLERYAAVIIAEGIEPGIILNKSDLALRSELDSMIFRIRERLPGINIISTSVLIEEGLDDLQARLKSGKTYCFVGSSGVGKSSIINKLSGEEVLKTKNISEGSKGGRHVTTTRALFLLYGGAMVIDNPGMREFGVLDSDAGIKEMFDEIAERAKSCKFSNCTHVNEQNCAIRSAIESGVLDKAQYESYDKLKKEDDFHNMTNLDKRRKNRAFGKFIKKAKVQVKRYKE